MEPLRVVIVDDQKLFRENLKIVIELRIPSAEVVGVAENGVKALEIIKNAKPNLILLDMRMPVMDGVEVIKHLSEERIDSRIIVLTTFDDDQYLFEALQFGVAGYLLKDIEPEELTNSLLRVHAGGTLISSHMTAKLVNEVTKQRRINTLDVSEDALSSLTRRELEVLRRIGLGEDNKEIANGLHLAEGTVRNYVSTIYEKLGLKDRAQAIRYAIMSNLI